MGIIKTAMMMGGGMYAVNKIAKTAETRRSSGPRSNNGQYDARGYEYPPQGYQGSQGPPPFQPQDNGRNVDDNTREDYPPQQGYYLPNKNAWTPPQGYSLVKNDDAIWSQRGCLDEALDGAPQTLMPPPYANQRQRDFVFPQDQGYENQGRSPSPLPALAGKAMDYAMSVTGGKSSKTRGGQGSDMLAGLFSK